MKPRYVKGTRKTPEGVKICKVCESPLPPRRSSYCSDECWYRNSPPLMRSMVQHRDKGVCSMCGMQTGGMWEADHIVPVSEGGGLCGLDGYRTLCKGRGTNNCHGKVTAELRKRLRITQIQKSTGMLF